MDWVVGIFLLLGFLFFWAVWVFGYWLPMAKEAQAEFKRQQAREKAAREALAESRPEDSSPRPNSAGPTGS